MKTQQTTEFIDQTPELFTLLGLAALSEDQKQLIRTELEQVVYKRIMVRALHTTPQQHREQAIEAMKRGDSSTALEQLLSGVHDMQSLVVDEVRRLRHELVDAVNRIISPSPLP